MVWDQTQCWSKYCLLDHKMWTWSLISTSILRHVVNLGLVSFSVGITLKNMRLRAWSRNSSTPCPSEWSLFNKLSHALAHTHTHMSMLLFKAFVINNDILVFFTHDVTATFGDGGLFISISDTHACTHIVCVRSKCRYPDCSSSGSQVSWYSFCLDVLHSCVCVIVSWCACAHVCARLCLLLVKSLRNLICVCLSACFCVVMWFRDPWFAPQWHEKCLAGSWAQPAATLPPGVSVSEGGRERAGITAQNLSCSPILLSLSTYPHYHTT